MQPFLALITPLTGSGGGTGIWGPNDPRPNPPIANVPGVPGYRPPQGGQQPKPEHPIVYPPGTDPSQPHPEHPIVIPDPPPPESGRPEHPINQPPDAQPPQGLEWVLGYAPQYGGWIWVLVQNQ